MFPGAIPYNSAPPNIATQVQPMPTISPSDNPATPSFNMNGNGPITSPMANQPQANQPNDQFGDVQNRIQALRQQRGFGNSGRPMPFLG